MQHTARPRRVTAIAAAAAVVALTALLPPAARAQQTPPVPQCNPTQFCLWVNTYYAGGRFASAGSDGNLFDNKFAGTQTTVANNASSLYNNGVQDTYDGVYIYYNRFSTTPRRCIPRGTRYANLANVSAGGSLNWNDNIVRYFWTTAC